ncbi:ATP-dependent DNA helicase RecQ [Ureibacillus xyleni]|uniref:ATP-dependent DNA helicase RecQ n=1 Tax=Ureibacillus xyleni TaxID=614648 RepID=A0A285RKP7_9BACL|nr:ATP-dependent DNA helicase RecQ [Ureibacillus xyleni]SOB94259.1 ATP-dependent DNA helicase RecQ [Ureibacillus xyleni]
MQLESILQQRFGYSSFRPGQKEVIEQILKGEDVIALLPTGMGKSMCYQLPGYVLKKAVLVISPLLSLMQDQVDQMKLFNEKRVVALNSFLNVEEKKRVINELEQFRFIFISPEMLVQPQVQQKLSRMELALIVVDEAHCISQWGFDFRPDYLRIGEMLTTPRPPILALSATATNKVLEDIEHYLKMKEPYKYMHSVDRPNIHLSKMSFSNRDEKLQWILQHITETAGPGIIYTQSRMKTQNISELLLQQGISAASYHGGMDYLDRQFVQQQFIEGTLDWIVATNAFGMGIHKQDVRQVIHESIPSNMANYMQEIGRAGRDGQDAVAILLYSERDEELAKFVGIDDLPTDYHVDIFEDYLKVGQAPTQMLDRGEISETAFRVLNYWMGQKQPNEVKQIFQNMKSEKMHSVEEVMKLITSSACMRETLVNYFGQTLDERPKQCCINCGLQLEDLLKPREIIITPNVNMTWKDRIGNILTKKS